MKLKSILIVILFCSFIYSQDSLDTAESESFFNKRNISILTLSGICASTLVIEYLMWWHNDFHPFNFAKHFEGEHWLNEPYTLGIDKIGHFYTSYFYYRLSRNLLSWGKFAEKDSRKYAFFLSIGLATIAELGDGFSNYGFDYEDLVFNMGGAVYGYVQDELPIMKNFNFKWSYIPTENFKFPPNITDTYEAHIYWLTTDVHNLFKKSIGKFWPEFLQLGVGMSISDDHKKREFILGLDFDLTKIFKTENEDLNLIINNANMLHFPAPGIKFTPESNPDYRFLMFN